MFYGGTNFGFTSGANLGPEETYLPDITSYDYDAPMTEAGDPTMKYYLLKDLILQHLPNPNVTIPKLVGKRNYGSVQLISCCSMLTRAGRQHLSTGFYQNKYPLTFENVDQNSGFLLYETWLPSNLTRDPSILDLAELKDTAYVYIDDFFIGILTREIPWYKLPISLGAGRRLQILVENQGRINYDSMLEFKGLTSNVTFDKVLLVHWNMTKFPLESYADIENYIKDDSNLGLSGYPTDHGGLMLLHGGPRIYYGTLNIKHKRETYDTYLNTTGWGKGVAFINGENIGRYWPLTGPQMTLYVPREVLRLGVNNIVLIEFRRPAYPAQISFIDEHIFI